jgi:hypothetical protein
MLTATLLTGAGLARATVAAFAGDADEVTAGDKRLFCEPTTVVELIVDIVHLSLANASCRETNSFQDDPSAMKDGRQMKGFNDFRHFFANQRIILKKSIISIF